MVPALAAVALGGCGGGGEDPDRTAATPSPTPAPAVATPPPTPAPTAKPRRRHTPTPEPAVSATPTPRPLAKRAQPVAAGVARYLVAINQHDIGELCSGFTGPTPEACGGPGEHLPIQPLLDGPRFLRATVTARPRFRRSGRRAEATVKLTVIDEAGGRTPRAETLALHRTGMRWAVSQPSAVFYRAINRQAP